VRLPLPPDAMLSLPGVPPSSDINTLHSHTPVKATTGGKEQLAAVTHPAAHVEDTGGGAAGGGAAGGGVAGGGTGATAATTTGADAAAGAAATAGAASGAGSSECSAATDSGAGSLADS
jgi:hypothetical protein